MIIEKNEELKMSKKVKSYKRFDPLARDEDKVRRQGSHFLRCEKDRRENEEFLRKYGDSYDKYEENEIIYIDRKG